MMCLSCVFQTITPTCLIAKVVASTMVSAQQAWDGTGHFTFFDQFPGHLNGDVWRPQFENCCCVPSSVQLIISNFLTFFVYVQELITSWKVSIFFFLLLDNANYQHIHMCITGRRGDGDFSIKRSLPLL